MAVTSIYDKLLQNLDNKKITCSIFLDLRKAFDSVHHDIILKKLHHYGFRGAILSFFEDYLNNRKICTKINEKTSSFHSVKYGVPQGSVLGPILFLLHVNDLPNVSKFETTLFADDTNLRMSHHNIQFLQQEVSQEINKVNKRLKQNKLILNYKKSNFMMISNAMQKSTNFEVIVNHNNIPLTNSVKYLGVILDNKLTWQPHIEQISAKLSRACGMIFKLRHYVPLSTVNLIYYSMFHSVLQYSLINWGRASKHLLYKIKTLQNRFLRASLFRPSRFSVNALYFECGVLKLDDMIDMEFAKFSFRFSNNMLPNYFNSYFTSLDSTHHHYARQKSKKDFFYTYSRTEWKKKMTEHKALEIWSKSPIEQKQASFFKFKKTFKMDALKNTLLE